MDSCLFITLAESVVVVGACYMYPFILLYMARALVRIYTLKYMYVGKCD